MRRLSKGAIVSKMQFENFPLLLRAVTALFLFGKAQCHSVKKFRTSPEDLNVSSGR